MSRTTADYRLRWATYGFCGLILTTAYSQARVQVIDRGNVLASAEKTSRFYIESTDHAKRGRVFAADGRPLARDEESYVLRVDFRKVPHSDGFFADLSAATGVPATEFASLALSGKKGREWKQTFGPEQSKKVQRVKSEWRADGVSLARTGKREYPLAEAGAGVIGAVRNGEPVSGLELSQNRWLGGRNGLTSGLVDRTGAFLPMRLNSNSVEREDGSDIHTTIDFDLQQVASREIARAVDENKADQGVAIVLDPKTGDILAMANWPTFDPTVEGGRRPGMPQVRDLNPATMARLEPGSTFKILTLAKALDEGKVREFERLNCPGQLLVGRRYVRCDAHGGSRAHGNIDITDAIAKSCNVAAASWAKRVGHKEFVRFVEDLGLLEKPGTGLPGELKGDFNYNEPAKELQLATVGFGQSINTTPIALAAAFGSIGNGGRCMFPRLITRIGTKDYPPEEAAKVVSPETATIVLRTMEAVIESEHGTGHSLRVPGYRLGGKTGTAQRIGAGRRGYVSNFVGYVPANDPKAVVLVMVDNPKAGKYYGASVAGPAFVELAKAIIRRYDLPPTQTANTEVKR